MTKTQTRTHAPKPIPALLEGSFGTSIENRIAEINNQLAREGRLTNDPLAVALRSLRGSLKEHGFSFERVTPGAVTTVTPVATAAPKAAKANAPKAAAAPKANAPKAAPAAAAPTTHTKARAIKPEQIEEMQVAGSVSETAPYGLDDKGRALAPYGIKNDGVTPMKRRGRVAAAPAAAPEPKAAKAPKATAAPVAVEEETEEEPETVEAAASAVAEAEEETETEDDLDDLLSGL